MGKWLTRFLDETPEDQTDIPDTLADSGRISALSVPLPATQTRDFHPWIAPSASPLPAYCFVAYADSTGKLRGGWEERSSCTVKQCHGLGAACQVELSNGDMIPLRAVRSVGQLNSEGRLVSAWTVKDHGYDGEGSKT